MLYSKVLLNEIWNKYSHNKHKLNSYVLKLCDKLILKITVVLPFLIDKIVETLEGFAEKQKTYEVEEAFQWFQIESILELIENIL